ncbi:MAG TPA: DUF305 domain-containing protein [Chitinophagaceae bacterium]|nr:DUF305 domain-containing protein [Chitinophagaceae bacterium]
MKNKILIAAVLIISVCFLPSCDNTKKNTSKSEMDSSMDQQMHMPASSTTGSDNAMMQAMNMMKNKMNEMKMTGDFDLDFANMMIIHHQSAIDMSRAVIDKGTDAQIRTMAQNIITAQNMEIGQLQAFIKDYKIPDTKKTNQEMHNELDETMKGMMDNMNNMQMTENTDKDFVRMMIVHHESAVKMAGDELSHGKQYAVKKMAQKMVEDQSKEINDFKAWLSSQK